MRNKEIRIKPHQGIFSAMGLKDVQVEEICFSSRAKVVTLICHLPSPQELSELDLIYNSLTKTFGPELDVNFKISYSQTEISTGDFLHIVNKAVERLKKRNALSRSFLYLYRVAIVENEIHFELKNELAIETLYASKINHRLEDILASYGVNNFKVVFLSGDFSGEIQKINQEINDRVIPLTPKAKPEEKVEKTPQKSNKNVIYRSREIKGSTISISDFFKLLEQEVCVIEGDVFSIDFRETKSGKYLVTLLITDYSNSLTAKLFINNKEDLGLSKGDRVKVNGKMQLDRFDNNEPTLMISTINKLEKEEADEKRIDRAEEKMVELHTHSKMSEMVGVTDIGDLIKQAIAFGHKSMAITDYGVVHAFPFAHKAAKGKDFKVIFGCEIFMVDDTIPMVRDAQDRDIEEETFVVFDLETMGLNIHNHEITEIGAVKLKGTRIVERYSQLINPGRPIPQKIQELTGITDAMVANMPTIEEVLPQFLEFIGDATLVAHNAAFDMGFLRREVKRILGVEFNPPIIDTLKMAKDLFPEQKSYALNKLTKFLGVALERHHRAVDDSQATARMFVIFLEKYLAQGVRTLKDLTGIFPFNYAKQDVFNAIVLVKDSVGLKNLYKLVSEAHLNYFGDKKPKIPKSLLAQNREGLLVGGLTTTHFKNRGELSTLYLENDFEKLHQNMDFYDYIELLPNPAHSELWEEDGTGTIKDFSEIEEMNKYLYKLAKVQNKLVIGSSNVHYLEPEEQKIRAILLYGSGNVFRESQYQTDNKFFFRTTDELLDAFSYFGEEIAKEIVVKNTNAIEQMIEKVQPVPSGFYPPKIDNAENIVREMTYEKAYEIYGNPLPEIVAARIERELNAIIGNGFSVLYLSAQKLVKRSLDNGYLVGSRGSVGSSIVAYMMGITEVNALYPHYLCTDQECKYSEFIEREGAGVDLPDKNCPCCGKPLKKDGHSIPFEVFMGFDGDKVPDIDLNFSGEYQSEIHRYCEQLFGKENVFKAGTISTLAEKNAAGYVMKYYEEHGININRAETLRLAQKCDGAKKTTGQHPGGMIVVPAGHSIYEFCPVQRPANDMKSDSITTHYDYHVMDEQLVKLDILGHDDPTTIKLLQDYTGVDIYEVPLADSETLKIFSGTTALGVTPEQIGSEVGTYGVPEFGTSFVRQMLMDTKPTTFAELVRISGLSHGTDVWLNNAQEFVRAGQATLSQIISVRDDIMNFLIDQGIEKGTAFKIMEFVRKGQPTKNPDQWKSYSDLMMEHQVPEWYIESCRRIKYMFPKGHAVAYVMMAMRIAYFKVHYPLAFYAAYFSRKAEDFDYEVMYDLKNVKEKIEELNGQPKLDVKKKTELALCEIIVEMKARGFEFLPIDIYKSDGFKFKLEDDKIRIPLIGLAGLGGAVVENILKEREESKFLSYEDLKKRTKASQTIIDKLKEYNAVEALSETNQISLF
jgi:DNA polymerase-3 subunit alpha (Gram-positive type)